ncbi:MAG: hypothetical protein K1X78_11760 [Verrucomicrobiaceae bacterium]|nr:hypothetical protein [Verrucomicrobiaceae bacterium]
MPTEATSFESLFAAIGRKLDSDPELKKLWFNILALMTEKPSAASAEVAATAQELQITVESQPQLIESGSDATPEQLASSEDLVSLVENFAPTLAPGSGDTVTSRIAGIASVELIDIRLKLKQEAFRLALERAEAKSNGENVHSTGHWFRDVISQAKSLPNCYLWMCQPMHDGVDALKWRQASICFQAMLKALVLANEVRQLNGNRSLLERSLYLVAEAQSVVRSVCSGFNWTDADQEDVFHTLLNWSGDEQFYIERYMKADDLADPSNVQDLLTRISSLNEEVAKIKSDKKLRADLMSKIRYEVKSLPNDPSQIEQRWSKIISCVDELVRSGLPASNAELRSILIDHLDDLPEIFELPEGFKGFIRAVDSYIATQEPDKSVPIEDSLTQEVKKAASFLKGAEVVIIGGDCRSQAKGALMKAFGLSDLNWIETRPHESTSTFEASVARENVKLVLLAIRWSSHSYGDVKDQCDKHGKILVRLPRGYGVNQVAAEICSQCRL